MAIWRTLCSDPIGTGHVDSDMNRKKPGMRFAEWNEKSIAQKLDTAWQPDMPESARDT